MSVTVTFKLGNRTGMGKAAGQDGLNTFVNGLGDIATDQAIEAAGVDVPALQARMDRAIARSLQRAVNYARLNILGTMSASGSERSPTQIYFDTIGDADGNEALPRAGRYYWYRPAPHIRKIPKIEWEPLSTRTRLSKIKSGKSRNDALRHYLNTGALRRDLASMATQITQATGTVKIGYIKNKAKRFSPIARQRVVQAGRLQLTFLPNVPLSYLPALKSGDVRAVDRQARFEDMLPLDADSKEKLKGWSPGEAAPTPRQVHRPLLQPIISYWVLNKTPELVSSAISRSLLGR